MWPNAGLVRDRPPIATAASGCAPNAQHITSMLWTCCSTMWSPHSQVKLYQLRRPEAGRRGQDDVVHVGLEQLFVGVQADELAVLGHVECIAKLLDGAVVLDDAG